MVDELPVLVVGAGPQGLAAAAHLLERGLEPLVLEAGPVPAAAVRAWGHVRLFSPWPELVDAAAARLLAASGWTAPASGFPTGSEWVSGYLEPLARALGDRVRCGTRVTGVSRRGRDRLVSPGRAEEPFVVHVVGADGTESRVEARAVVDASGTWWSPNPLGADGLPALGERAAAGSGRLTYRAPCTEEATELAGRRVAVVGNGHSAMTALLDLVQGTGTTADTEIIWVLRRAGVGFGGGAADELPQRGRLGQGVRAAVEAGRVRVVTGFRVAAVEQLSRSLELVAEDGRRLGVDHVVALTGFRPDLSFLSEVRLDLDPVLQAPRGLAAQVDPNLHSCGSVLPHGARELEQPEPGLFLVGMKSYGRAPTFLALTGYEQVRSVAAALAGDAEAAVRVELTLPETGVCGGSGLFDEPVDGGSGCCGTSSAEEPVLLTPAVRLVTGDLRADGPGGPLGGTTTADRPRSPR